jgi:diguanylate cyclase (GGDEF)-like protein/PAS domain S-box-containing protein
MLEKNIATLVNKYEENNTTLVYIIDIETYEILYANQRCMDDFGSIVGKVCYKVLQKGEESPCSYCSLSHKENSLQYPIGSHFEWENLNSITQKHYLFNDFVVLWKNNRKVKIQVGIDISKQKSLEKELTSEKISAISSFEALLDSTIEGILIHDRDKHCKHVNSVAAKMLGYSREEMIDLPVLQFVAPESHALVKKHISNTDQEPYEAFLMRKDGSKFPAILRGHDLVLAGENIRVSAMIDITNNKKYEEKILKLAHYDILTALPNRVQLKDYILRSIQRSNRNSEYNALFFIDLDNFKTVNDTVGHDIGDLVLIETARRIENSIRKDDVVARLGGDEFVILIDTGERDREVVTNRVSVIAQKVLDGLKKPYLIKNYEFRITASIGIKLYNDNALSMDELMKYADSAMYNAKEEGRNNYKFFNPKLQHIMEEKILLLDDLRRAIEEHAMRLYYQPQVDINGKTIGVEALIRWIDPLKGVISPVEFIPIAEESGLIIELGEWIFNEALKQIKIWESDTAKELWRVSINVSAKQFAAENFVDMLESALQKSVVSPNKIRLELTEGILIQNLDETLQKLHTIKSIGISLSIDDFGTGYSSLAYLKKLPMDELKIDQSFICDLIADDNDEIITQTIISMGSQFGLEVIAEGVETDEQYQKLRSMGCQYFQGYLFSKPKEACEL